MRTDLAQFYMSTKPSVRLNYISSEATKVNFTINGTDLLLRDFNIFATTKTNHRAVLEQLKNLALNNNTSGASIFDLGNIIKADSISEVTDILHASEKKQEAIRQQQMQQEQQMQQAQIQAQAEENRAKLEFTASENQKDRENNITTSEIRAAGYGAQSDINENKVSDYQDALKDIKLDSDKREEMNFKREQASMKNSHDKSKLEIEREKLAAQMDVANKNLEIARVNKNKYDVKKPKK
jgi:hypothetical protein